MVGLKTRVLRAGLDTLHYSGLCTLLDGRTGGVGVIFMLHHVLGSYSPPAFAPNRGLEVSADFLDLAIREVTARGYDIVDLDEARRRLLEARLDKRFACITLDDGYEDNYRHAFPVFARHNAPFTLYVNSGLPNGTAILWWRLLERVLADNDRVEAEVDGRKTAMETRDPKEKYRAWNTIYRSLWGSPPDAQRTYSLALCDRYGVDAAALCREVAISWPQLREMQASGLATIGMHTASHSALSALSAEDIESEIARDREVLSRELAIAPRHFAYPYGDRHSAGPREFSLVADLGIATATTTRKGVLYPEHADHLHALPRLSLNGDFQQLRYLRALMSGAPFALRRGFRRLDVA